MCKNKNIHNGLTLQTGFIIIDNGEIKTSFAIVLTIFPYNMSINKIPPRTGQIISPKVVGVNTPFPLIRPSETGVIFYKNMKFVNYSKRFTQDATSSEFE